MIKTALKQYKFVLVGDSAVGKSSILNRFVDKTYSQSLLSTIGVDFKFKRVKIQGAEVKLQIWDTAGQQTFRSIVSAYYSSADAIIIVYDITSYDSFENIKSYWIGEAENNNKNNAKIFLIGNKIDEQSRREVEQFTLDTFIQEHNVDGVYEASAKTGQNVDESFIAIAKSLYLGISVRQPGPNSKIQKPPTEKNNPLIKQRRLSQDMKIDEHTTEQYEEVLSVDQQTRKQQLKQDRNEPRMKQQGGNITLNGPKKPKNPNYNKGCCLK